MTTPRLDVVGLGPGGADLVTQGTRALLDSGAPVHVRTARHPAVAQLDVLAGAVSHDHHYERAAHLDEVYRGIVDDLLAAVRASGRVVYAVPGSPVVAERTVELLRTAAPAEAVQLVVHPAMSFVDLAWVRLGVDPLAAGVRLVDGHRFETEAAGERGPLLVAQVDRTDALVAVKLALGEAVDLGATPAPVTVLRHLGLPDESIEQVDWHVLDRVVPDHLTSLFLPSSTPPVAAEVQRFAELVATLRRECPWDREQTHASLRRHLLEETYEVLEAIDGLDDDDGASFGHLEEELGDLLFQVLFHTTLAAEAGRFTLADVARGVHDKLRDRHPHVFGDVRADTADEVAATWEERKRAEKGRASVFDGIPDALPALALAAKAQKKAAGVRGDAMPALDPAAALVRARARPSDDAVGELLFAAVDLARRAGVDAETALRATTRRYMAEWRGAESAPGS